MKLILFILALLPAIALAQVKVSDLPALGAAPATNDLLMTVDVSATTTKKMTVANLFTNPVFTGGITTDGLTLSSGQISWATGGNLVLRSSGDDWIQSGGLNSILIGLNDIQVAEFGTTGFSLGFPGSSTGSLLFRGTTSGIVTMKSADAAGTWTMTLPTSAGTNGFILSTNGSGVTSWVADSGGSLTDTFVGYGSGANALTGEAAFAYNATNNTLTVENISGVTTINASTSFTTDSTTFALLNSTATTVNAFGAATTLNIGASAATVMNFGGSTTAAEFRFLEPSASGTNYSGFKAPAQGANITYTLPATVGAAGTVLTDAAGNGTLSWAAGGGGGAASAVHVDFDGGGVPIAAGTVVWKVVPTGFTISKVTMVGDATGSAVVDIWKCTYAQWDAGATHPVAGDKITSSAPPTISAATKSQDSTLTGWTTTVSDGDILYFTVTSSSTFTKLTITVE